MKTQSKDSQSGFRGRGWVKFFLSGYLFCNFLLCAPMAFAARRMGQDSPDTPEVNMGEYLVTDAQDFSFIQTYGVFTCVAVSLYDPVTGTGLLAHIAPMTNISQAMKTLFAEFRVRNIPARRLQAHMVGGADMGHSQEVMVASIARGLVRGGARIVEKDVLSPTTDPSGLLLLPGASKPKSVELNLKTGELLDYFESIASVQGQDPPPAGDPALLYRHKDSLKYIPLN